MTTEQPQGTAPGQQPDGVSPRTAAISLAEAATRLVNDPTWPQPVTAARAEALTDLARVYAQLALADATRAGRATPRPQQRRQAVEVDIDEDGFPAYIN